MEDARLPTEQEKVAFFDLLGIDRRRLPHRVYQGAVGSQTRYFALKLPIAVDTKTATFTYVDPGKDTDTELRSWGDSHEWLWRALRLKGIEVHVVVIGADHKATIRAEAALNTWSSRGGEQSSQRADGPSRNDPDVKAEIQYIEDAVLSLDTDIIANRNLRKEGRLNILPLVMDLTNISPSQGWAGNERQSLPDRGKPDLALCLALIHHMVISANIPAESFLAWLSRLGTCLIIEFVGKDDPMVRQLLLNKDDTYDVRRVAGSLRSVELFEEPSQGKRLSRSHH